MSAKINYYKLGSWQCTCITDLQVRSSDGVWLVSLVWISHKTKIKVFASLGSLKFLPNAFLQRYKAEAPCPSFGGYSWGPLSASWGHPWSSQHCSSQLPVCRPAMTDFHAFRLSSKASPLSPADKSSLLLSIDKIICGPSNPQWLLCFKVWGLNCIWKICFEM